MGKYLVFIERKPTFSGNSIPEHRAFIQALRQQELLVIAGGFSDQTGGAYVVLAHSLESAIKTVEQDPMYVENECIYKIKEWNCQ